MLSASSIRLWPPDTRRFLPSNWRKPCLRPPGAASPGVRAPRRPLASRFAAARVRPAHRDYWRSALRAEEWFPSEWPLDEVEPTKYWLSTLPEDTELADLVDQGQARMGIERDYQELKQEIGLGHYEGRGWRGFHHHATLSIAAYRASSGDVCARRIDGINNAVPAATPALIKLRRYGEQ